MKRYDTKIIVPEKDSLEEIVKYFETDVVPFPSETVYGLGAVLWREDLIRRVFEVKNRPGDNPLIVHVSSLEMLRECIEGEIPEAYVQAVEKFWPGPLTLLFRKNKRVPSLVTAGGDLVAVRMPGHPVLLKVIEAIGSPLVGPSANKSTRPSPTTALHVYKDLEGDVPVIIDGGPCLKGVESTVVNGLVSPPLLLRPGSISLEELEMYIPGISLLPQEGSSSGKLACPGLKYKHYSPIVPVFLVRGTEDEQVRKLIEIGEGFSGSGSGYGLMALNSTLRRVFGDLKETFPFRVFSLGDSSADAANRLFSGLRSLDGQCERILIGELSSVGEGRAVMDRIVRASSFSV